MEQIYEKELAMTSDKAANLGLIKKKISEKLIVIAFYIVLTVILTYPVFFEIRTHIAGKGDAFQVLWSLWYSKIALLNPDVSYNYITYIFYPDGVHISIPFGSAFNQFLSIPLQSLFGLVVTYNLLWLLSFLLSGYGTYLLVNYLTGNKTASLIAGIVFAFSPFHYAHALGHIGTLTIQWIPFCALYLMKIMREKSLKNALYAAIFFILVVMSDLQFIVYMGLFVGLLFIYGILIELKLSAGLKTLFERIVSLKYLLRKYLLFSVLSFAGVLPFTKDTIKTALSDNNFLQPDPSDSIRYSADLLGFFSPSSLHPLLGSWFSMHVNQFFTGNVAEYTTYIGYTVLILSIYAVIKLRKSMVVKFWGISAIIFILMSLGPVLKIMGQTQFTRFNITIPLPYIIVSKLVPFISNSRTIARFDVIVMLSFAVLAGYGISEINKKIDSNKRKNIFSLVITILIIFEFLSVPVVTSFADEPVFYKQISHDTEKYALLEIPATTNYTAGLKSEYYQTIHGKPIVGGQVARAPSGTLDFQNNTPFVREITFMHSSNYVLNQNISEIGESVLNYYNIRYVILHIQDMTQDQLNFSNDLLQSTLKEKPDIYDEDSLVVYTVKNSSIMSFMSQDVGWNGLEEWNDVPTQWMENNGTIKIYYPDEKRVIISFNSTSFYKPRTLQAYVNGLLVFQKELLSQNITTEAMEVSLKRGENSLRFYTPDGCQHPIDIPELNNNDSRCLSLAFQNITLT
ncbi:MAG: hypothetical protein O8C61_13045 [Candidatus Methanoperedens sp.]|nr:hypothetical protein [Candidatus Methanoperedens sp.]